MATQGKPPSGEWNGWPWDFSGFPHDDYGPPLNYGIWALTALAAGFLGLRIYCKRIRHRGLWWDDHFLIVSWAVLVAQTALITLNTTIGYGKHTWDFYPRDLSMFLLVSNTSGFFAILAAMWSKTSFAITVLRISQGQTRYLIWFIIVSINAVLGFAALSTYIQCTPTEKLWMPFMKEGSCWPKQVIINYNIFAAAYSGAMDIILALLPWKIILSLTLNKRERIGVLIAMSMGVFAGVASLAKITQLEAINKADLIDGIWLSVLGTAESSVTIIAASIPVLRALFRHMAIAPPPPGVVFYISNNDNNGGDSFHPYRNDRQNNNNGVTDGLEWVRLESRDGALDKEVENV